MTQSYSTILWRVTTRYIGADGSSMFFFDTEEKATAFLWGCNNGAASRREYISDLPLNYSDGCTWDDLIMGGAICVYKSRPVPLRDKCHE